MHNRQTDEHTLHIKMLFNEWPLYQNNQSSILKRFSTEKKMFYDKPTKKKMYRIDSYYSEMKEVFRAVS